MEKAEEEMKRVDDVLRNRQEKKRINLRARRRSPGRRDRAAAGPFPVRRRRLLGAANFNSSCKNHKKEQNIHTFNAIDERVKKNQIK